LNQRRFEYWREAEIGEILALHDKRPDFLVETPVPIRFLLELTSFEQDTALDQIDPSVRVFSLGAMSLQKRANRLVRDAAEQLVPYATNNRPTLVMLDNYRQKGISLDKHTLGGCLASCRCTCKSTLKRDAPARKTGHESMMGALSPEVETAT
jgi:hypothetical protein